MIKNKGISRFVSLCLLCVLIVTFCSCEPSDSSLLAKFKVMTSEEPTHDHLKDAVSFIDENIENVSTESANRLVLAYEDYLLKLISEKQGEEPQENEAELFIYANYFEDVFVRSVDYDALISRYRANISAELVEFFQIKARETKEPSVQNAVLQISYDTLLLRGFLTENLLLKHSGDDLLGSSALNYYENYLFLILAGSDLTPVFDYDTGEFSPVAKDAYENFIIEHPDSVLSAVLMEYFAYLNDIEYTIDYLNAVENKVFYDTCDYLIKEAIKKF